MKKIFEDDEYKKIFKNAPAAVTEKCTKVKLQLSYSFDCR